MGYNYKLKTEIKEFLLKEKKANPHLSCRILAELVEKKFHFNFSKSSINLIIKTAGLSMPVGRYKKKKRRMAVAVSPAPDTAPEIKLIGAPSSEVAGPIPVEKTPEITPPKPVEEPRPIEPPKPPEAPLPQETPRPVVEEKEAECTGAILLKAMDALIGGSRFIVGEIRKQLPKEEPDLLAKTDALIYLPLFNTAGQKQAKIFTPLCSLVDKEVFLEDVLSYLNLLQSVGIKGPELLSGISNLLRQARGVKIKLLSGKEVYLDAQLHTAWPTRLTPGIFSTTIYNLKSYINKSFFRDQPLVFFMAPDSEAPSEEFFNLLLGLNSQGEEMSRLDIYGHKFEDLQNVQMEQIKRRFFVFGLMPGQYAECRLIKKIGDFSSFYFEPLKREFLIAETDVELSQPIVQQGLKLKGCVLKSSPADKPLLIILSNMADGLIDAGKLAQIYLERWPNLQEGLDDFNRRVEFFSYVGDNEGFFSTENLDLEDSAPDIKPLFNNYLKILDLYFKWYFLKDEFRNRDFPTMKGLFYDLKAILKKEKNRIFVTFYPPIGFPFQKDLEYACRRLNEREIEFSDGRRLWFRA